MRAGLVPEVPDPGEDHGQSQAVCGFDDFLVANGTSGLDDGGGSYFGDLFDAVGEGEERIGCGDRAFSGRTAFMAPILQESTRLICPAPTPTVWPSRA